MNRIKTTIKCMKRVCGIWLAGIALIAGAQAELWAQNENGIPSSDKKKLFYLSFDEDFKANGDTSPSNSDKLPELRDGVKGKGAYIGDGAYLKYSSAKYLNTPKGSVSLWIKNPSEFDKNVKYGWRKYLFQMEVTEATRSFIGLGLLPDLGAFLESGKDNHGTFSSSVPFPGLKKTDTWHQMVFTWDYARGIKIFLDGTLILNKLMQKAETPQFDSFFVGGNSDRKSQRPLVIDEFAIYNYELRDEEVWNDFVKLGGKFETSVRIMDAFLSPSTKGSLPVLFSNNDRKNIQITSATFSLSNLDDKKIQSGSINDFSLAGIKQSTVYIPVDPIDKPGSYLLRLSFTDNGQKTSFADTLRVLPKEPVKSVTKHKITPVVSIAASETKPITESGTSLIVNNAIGTYREAGSMKNDRFMIGFEIKDVDALHEAIVTYPDDKARTMEIVLQDLNGAHDYQAQTGVFTGNEYPVTGGFKKHRFLFWPHSARQSLIFMTEVNGQPAAYSQIQINKLDGLDAMSPKADFKGSVRGREIGLYYEDPVINLNFGTDASLSGFSKATTRLLDYMESFGQNVLHYPVVWYGGPLYGTSLQRYQPDIYQGQGGRRPHPDGYVKYLMERMQQRGMRFNAGLHIHTLQSIEDLAVTDKAAIDSGTETVLNVRGTGDPWYGKFHGSDPGYNPLDPNVQSAVKAIVNEIGQRYGNEPAFSGVTLTMARVKIFGFGSIQSGYNDSNLRNFQNETGIKIPGYIPGKASRFTDSYNWLMNTPSARTSWIDWRCKKLHDYYKEMADELAKYGKGIKLTLNIFPPFATYNRLSHYLTESPVDVLRESGIDPRLYKDDENIILGFTAGPADLRWRQSSNDKEVNIESNRTLFLAPEVVETLADKSQTELIIHDRYWEDPIGKNKPMKGISEKGNVNELTWRVSTLNATDFHAIEHDVAALNNSDVLRITKGGFLIGTYGMENPLADFSKAFRALPAVKFEDVAGVDDPIRVRQRVVDGKLFFYVLNRLPMALEMTLKLSQKSAIRDLVGNSNQSGSSAYTISMKPYGLSVFESKNPNVKVVGGAIRRSAWTNTIEERFEKISKTIPGLDAKALAPYKPYFEKAAQCMKEGQYARLYFLMQEGWVKDIERLVTEKAKNN